MDSQSVFTAGFTMSVAAGGAAVSITLRDRQLNFDIADSLKDRLRTEVADRIREGFLGFVIDLSRVEQVDSSGVGLLVAVHHQVVDAGGALALTGANEFVTRVLRMMKLDRFLILHRDPERALRAVTDPV